MPAKRKIQTKEKINKRNSNALKQKADNKAKKKREADKKWLLKTYGIDDILSAISMGQSYHWKKGIKSMNENVAQYIILETAVDSDIFEQALKHKIYLPV